VDDRLSRGHLLSDCSKRRGGRWGIKPNRRKGKGKEKGSSPFLLFPLPTHDSMIVEQRGEKKGGGERGCSLALFPILILDRRRKREGNLSCNIHFSLCFTYMRKGLEKGREKKEKYVPRERGQGRGKEGRGKAGLLSFSPIFLFIFPFLLWDCRKKTPNTEPRPER